MRLVPPVRVVREHPAPWWFVLLAWLMPGRCREIPEAQDPERIVLRQFAIIKRHVYLQQFAGSEDARWFHSHQWRRTIVLGLWGSYDETRWSPALWRFRHVQAPYLYTMDHTVFHHVTDPSKGHTSIVIGLDRDDDLKHYVNHGKKHYPPNSIYHLSETTVRHWARHIKKLVARI